MLNYIAGFLFGIFSGLIPGIHPNTVSSVVAEVLPASGIELAIFLALVYVVNSVAEFIPSIFLSAPSEATSLSLLPGHKMLLKGKGLQALNLAFHGAAVGSFFFVIFFIPTLFLIKPILKFASKFMFWLLLLIVGNAILKERKKLLATAIFLLAGTLGILSGKLPLGSDALLFALLTGGFGISTIAISLMRDEKIPKQEENAGKPATKIVWPALAGTFGGLLVGTLPAVSPSQAIYLLSSAFSISGEGFLTALGAVTATSFLFSLVTLYASGRARNGTAVLIAKVVSLDLFSLLLLLAVSLIGLLATILILKKLSGRIIKLFSKLDYFNLNISILLFLLLLINFWIGPLGLLVSLTASSLGAFCQLSGVKRTNLMGMLLLPTMLFYLGL